MGRKGGSCLVTFANFSAWWKYLDETWEDVRSVVFKTLPVLDVDMTDQAYINRSHEVMLRLLSRSWYIMLKHPHPQLVRGFNELCTLCSHYPYKEAEVEERPSL